MCMCKNLNWKKLAMFDFALAKIFIILAIIERIFVVNLPILPGGVRPVTLLMVGIIFILAGISCILVGIYDNTCK